MCVTILGQLLFGPESTLAPLEAPPTMDTTEFPHVDLAFYHAGRDRRRRGQYASDDHDGEEQGNGQRVHISSGMHLRCWMLYRLLHASHWHAQPQRVSTTADAAEGGSARSPLRVIHWEQDVKRRTFLDQHAVVINVFLEWVSETTPNSNIGANAAAATMDTAWMPQDWQSIAAASRARFSSPPKRRCCLS